MKKSGMNEGDHLKDDEPVSSRTRSAAQSGSTSTKVINTYRGPIKMSTRWTNPFLQGPVIRSLVKHVEHASEVKVYRRLNRDWDVICSQKLEQMANMGKLKKIDFNWSSEILKDAKKQFSEFLKDTEKNPKIFRRFAYNFPNALSLFHSVNSGSFLQNYSPLFLEVVMPYDLSLENDKQKSLFLDSLPWMSQMRELTFSCTEDDCRLARLPLPSGQWEEPLVFPNLEKIEFKDDINDYPANFVTGFKLVTLGSGKMRNSTPKLKSLLLNSSEDESLEELLGICPEYPDISRWNTLALIEIQRCDDLETLDKFISCLLSLGRNGMALTSFRLDQMTYCFSEDLIHLLGICNAFTEFFATQSRSLKNLDFKIEFENDLDDDFEETLEFEAGQFQDHKIELPVFQSLTHLSLNICNNIWLNDDGLGDLILWRSGVAKLFPRLKHLTLNEGEELEAMLLGKIVSGEEKLIPSLRLQHLEVTHPYNVWRGGESQPDFDRHIHSVDVFDCYFAFLPKGGEEIPWVDSLHKLIIKNVRWTLKLSHLNVLKELIVEDEKEINAENVLRFLGHFDGVASLNLKSILFRVFKLKDKIKKEFMKKFPFPVKFEDKIGRKYRYCQAHLS